KLCTHVDYASPQTSPVRVLNAVAQQTVTGCGDNAPILAKKRFEYDRPTGAQAGQVTSGFVSANIVTRFDMDTYAPLGDIREFDVIKHDAVGNPLTVTRPRDDGATQTTKTDYDAFGLVPVKVPSSATNADGTPPLLSLTSSIIYD